MTGPIDAIEKGVTMMSKRVCTGLLVLWSMGAGASGWNDFEKDIGHGFRIWKTDSFSVCLSLLGYSAIVCGDRNKGDYGPITGYHFTDNHLLVRTIGAKPSDTTAYPYAPDPDRQHYFIVDKQIANPYRYVPVGPLDPAQFHANPIVPAVIPWLRPSR